MSLGTLRTSAACGREWGRGGPGEETGPAAPRPSPAPHVHCGARCSPLSPPAARPRSSSPTASACGPWVPPSPRPRPGFRPPRSEGRPHGWRRLRAEAEARLRARLPPAAGRGPAEAEAGVARRRPDARPRSVRAGTRSCGSGGSCSRPASTRPPATAATTATAPWRMARKSLESGCSWRRQRGGVRSASTCATCPW